jgi:hypothetical protein
MPQDDEDPNDPSYQLYVLLAMVKELPPGISGLIKSQLSAYTNALFYQLDRVKQDMNDLSLNLQFIEFDRNALKIERDKLQAVLDRMDTNE